MSSTAYQCLVKGYFVGYRPIFLNVYLLLLHNDRQHSRPGNHDDRQHSRPVDHDDRQHSRPVDHDDRQHSRPVDHDDRQHSRPVDHDDRQHSRPVDHDDRQHSRPVDHDDDLSLVDVDAELAEISAAAKQKFLDSKVVCFDVDSTVLNYESLDDFARYKRVNLKHLLVVEAVCRLI